MLLRIMAIKPLRFKHPRLYAITIALVVVALAIMFALSGKSADGGANNHLSTVPSDFKVTRSSSGSLTGRGDENRFTIDASGHVSQQNTRLGTNMDKQLSDAQVLAIARQVQSTDFFNLDDNYPKNGSCCDKTSTTLDITMSGKHKKVSFYREISPSEVEASLSQLDTNIAETVGD
jgi:hypothetical protein